jgi:hypothetical protein
MRRVTMEKRVEIEVHTTVSPGGGVTVTHTVACPIRHESRSLEDCEICDRCVHLTPEESFLVCELSATTEVK